MRQLLPVLIVCLACLADTRAADWPYWRGPEQTGVSREKDLPEKFDLETKENVVFAVPYAGITSPIVMKGRVYTIGKCGSGESQQENVQCFDADTGKLIWEKKYNVWLTGIVEDRLGFTNVAGDPETENVYAHFTSGMFVCFDKNGKALWEHSLTEEFGRVSGYGGRITSPIVDEDKVIISLVNGSWGEQTIGGTRIVAFDKKTGKVIWWGSGGRRVTNTYSSSPTVAVVGGKRLVFTSGGDGCVHAFEARTGRKMWTYQYGSGAMNCTPVVLGNKLWIAHGAQSGGSQGRIVCVDASEVKDGKPKLIWEHTGNTIKFASPCVHDGLLYVCEERGKLLCFDAEKGPIDEEPLWEFDYGRFNKGSPIWADGKIYITDVSGTFSILKPDRKECKLLFKKQFPPVGIVKTELHGSPAFANGRIYFTTTNQLICIGKKGHKAKPDPIKPMPKEAPKAGARVAHLQVVPADVTIHPGEKVDFQVYAYNDMGQKLGEVDAAWATAGVLPPVFPPGIPAPKPDPKAPKPPAVAGELSAKRGKSATFTAAKMPNGGWGRVTVKVGSVEGYARVRVAPTLPYAMDFAKVPIGRTPPWVNCPGKFSVVTGPDGKKVLSKRNNNAAPPVLRANAYIGTPDMTNYTISADMYAGERVGNLPDMGLGACRYNLTMAGNSKVVRLESWDAEKRIVKSIPFTMKDKTWYSMKLSAEFKGGKGFIKGKVWERGQMEPAKWTIEVVDSTPNMSGSPTLYGYPNGARDTANPGPDLYFANVKVVPGKK